MHPGCFPHLEEVSLAYSRRLRLMLNMLAEGVIANDSGAALGSDFDSCYASDGKVDAAD